MKKWIGLVGALAFLWQGTAHAGFLENCGCGVESYYVGGEATFLKACVQDTYFVTLQPSNVSSDSRGPILAVHPDYEPGFAIWVGAKLCDCSADVRIKYDHLRSKSKRRINSDGEFIRPLKLATELTQGPFLGVARSDIIVEHDDVDLEVRRPFLSCGRFQSQMISGLRWARIRFSETGNYLRSADGEFAGRDIASRSWGFGPRVGGEGHMHIWKGLSAVGELTGGLLIGEIGHTNRQSGTIDDSVVNNTFDDTCAALPLTEWKLGLEYDYCICGWNLSLMGGFQATQYWSAIMNTNYNDDTDDNKMQVSYRDLNLFGFYAGLEARF